MNPCENSSTFREGSEWEPFSSRKKCTIWFPPFFPKGVIFTFDLVFAFLFLCHKILANSLLTSLQLSFCVGQLFEKNFGPFFSNINQGIPTLNIV
jgi:hypothetical protein